MPSDETKMTGIETLLPSKLALAGVPLYLQWLVAGQVDYLRATISTKTCIWTGGITTSLAPEGLESCETMALPCDGGMSAGERCRSNGTEVEIFMRAQSACFELGQLFFLRAGIFQIIQTSKVLRGIAKTYIVCKLLHPGVQKLQLFYGPVCSAV